MADIKQQIFNELEAIEQLMYHLKSDANCASKQTDLEVAILTKQIKNLREKNEKATALIDKSILTLKKLS